MELREIQTRIYAADPLTRRCVVVPTIPAGRYHLQFGHTPSKPALCLDTQRGHQREFKTIDAAVKVGRSLGFVWVDVYLPDNEGKR